jgi:hypothetical protein
MPLRTIWEPRDAFEMHFISAAAVAFTQRGSAASKPSRDPSEQRS